MTHIHTDTCLKLLFKRDKFELMQICQQNTPATLDHYYKVQQQQLCNLDQYLLKCFNSALYRNGFFLKAPYRIYFLRVKKCNYFTFVFPLKEEEDYLNLGTLQMLEVQY